MARSNYQERERERKLALVMERLEQGDLIPSWVLGKLIQSQLRTVHRYIAILRQRGVSIGGCRGHGGGVILLKPKRKVA
jgi:predicted DNA-binding transcriptional regulator YafY